MTAEFFKLNDPKLEPLIEAIAHDMKKAETAVLWMANNQYRKIIFNAPFVGKVLIDDVWRRRGSRRRILSARWRTSRRPQALIS